MNSDLTFITNEKNKLSAPALTNAARRQAIPAFREKGVWKIPEGFKPARP